MKELLIEEVAAISPELAEAAARVGCTHVRLTGRIWPGGQITGPTEKGVRFAEYSWLKAAVLSDRIVYEEDDVPHYTALLREYGLSDEPPSLLETPDAPLAPLPTAPAPATLPPAATTLPSSAPVRLELTVQLQPATLVVLHQRATALGLGLGEFLDRHFSSPPDS